MAIDILSIPAMSSSPKRLFSSAKITITDRRNWLGIASVQALECLKSWMGIIELKDDDEDSDSEVEDKEEGGDGEGLGDEAILGQIWCNTAYIGNMYRLRYDSRLPCIGTIRYGNSDIGIYIGIASNWVYCIVYIVGHTAPLPSAPLLPQRNLN